MSARVIEFPAQGIPGTLVRYTEGGGEPVELDACGPVALSSGSRLVYVLDATGADGSEGGDEAFDTDALATALAQLPPDAFVVADLAGATDALARAIAGQRALRTLVLAGDFTDEAVAALGGMPGLTDLVLESPLFTGAGLDALTGSETAASLGSLVLSEATAFRPEHLRALTEAPHLTSLTLDGMPVGHDLAGAVLAHLPQLAEVSVAECPGHAPDPAVLERLLAAGLCVNGISAPPENAALFAGAAAEAATPSSAAGQDDGEDEDGEDDEEAPEERGVLREVVAEGELERLLAGPVPVLVALTAPWCGPCAFLTPVLEDAVEARGAALTGVKVDVDQAAWAQDRFDVLGVPTVLLLREGREVFRFSGVATRRQIEGWLATAGVAAR
ncbi:thioredoxin family protein [Streptomyces roseoverticillatus]|uniref:thioredoxin family protein n=1 Tax=Streptomyces roseoverticillatus TaxID=66429 RepID=UPI001F3319FA|nr:thioredoxin family protein [Streptomyces roseoverticillatus]MCF3101203.1 thioredoxin family protein [Streptomyces roseoverticillatus]